MIMSALPGILGGAMLMVGPTSKAGLLIKLAMQLVQGYQDIQAGKHVFQAVNLPPKPWEPDVFVEWAEKQGATSDA